VWGTARADPTGRMARRGAEALLRNLQRPACYRARTDDTTKPTPLSTSVTQVRIGTVVASWTALLEGVAQKRLVRV